MLSHSEKLVRIASFTEDDFRDAVVRPIFLLQGYNKYHDTCGADEEGRDCVLLKKGEFDQDIVCAIQTKSGNLNMSREPAKNVHEAIAQLRTALNTKIPLLHSHTTVLPDYVYLCASGRINLKAKRYITDEVDDRRLKFLDAEDLISAIDERWKGFWLRLSPYWQPYLQQERKKLLAMSDAVLLTSVDDGGGLSPISDEAYVSQKLFRVSTRFDFAKQARRENSNSKFGLTGKAVKALEVPHVDEIDDDNILQEASQPLVVSGEGGTGKSTLIRRLALKTIDKSLSATRHEDCKLPLLIRAIDAIHIDSLDEFVIQQLSVVGSIVEQPGLDELKSGKIVLLIDAIDEIGDPVGIEHVIKLVEEFNKSYPGCQVILTARPIASVKELATAAGFNVYEIADFSIKQAAKIVSRAIKGETITRAAATEILRKLQDVHGLKLSPMLVTIFAATTHFTTKDIPPNITSIFRKFVRMMLGEWDRQKGLHQAFEVDVKHKILARTALEWHRQGITAMPEDEFVKTIGEYFAELGFDNAKDLTSEIVRSGLIQQIDGQILFRHHLFQEYFCGTELTDVNEISELIMEEWWRTAIVFAYGQRADRGAEIEQLLTAIGSLDPKDGFAALVTVGLSIQACYLTPIDVRVQAMADVVTRLGRNFAEYVAVVSSDQKYPLNAFIYKMLESRDAVTSDLIMKVHLGGDAVHNEYSEFLRLSGAIEAGYIKEVYEDVIAFNPGDRRLLLGLHMLTLFVNGVKVSTAEESEYAKKITKAIQPKIEELLKEMTAEFKGMLIEMRKGKIAVLDSHQAEDQ